MRIFVGLALILFAVNLEAQGVGTNYWGMGQPKGSNSPVVIIVPQNSPQAPASAPGAPNNNNAIATTPSDKTLPAPGGNLAGPERFNP
jgi:hypothetical protein